MAHACDPRGGEVERRIVGWKSSLAMYKFKATLEYTRLWLKEERDWGRRREEEEEEEEGK